VQQRCKWASHEPHAYLGRVQQHPAPPDLNCSPAGPCRQQTTASQTTAGQSAYTSMQQRKRCSKIFENLSAETFASAPCRASLQEGHLLMEPSQPAVACKFKSGAALHPTKVPTCLGTCLPGAVSASDAAAAAFTSCISCGPQPSVPWSDVPQLVSA